MPWFRVPVHAGYISLLLSFHAAKTARGKGRIPSRVPYLRRIPAARDRSIAPRPIKSWPGTVSKFYGAVRPFRDKLLFGRVSTRLWNVSNTRSKQFTDVNHDPRGDPRENLSEASRFVSRLIIFFIKEESFFFYGKGKCLKFEYLNREEFAIKWESFVILLEKDTWSIWEELEEVGRSLKGWREEKMEGIWWGLELRKNFELYRVSWRWVWRRGLKFFGE